MHGADSASARRGLSGVFVLLREERPRNPKMTRCLWDFVTGQRAGMFDLVKLESLRAGRTRHANREVRRRVCAARRAYAALRARTRIATWRREVGTALTHDADLVTIAGLSALSAVQRVILIILVRKACAIAFVRAVRTIGDALAVVTNGVVVTGHAASATIFIVGIEVDAALLTGAGRQSISTSAHTVVTKLRTTALRATHSAIVRVGSGIDAAVVAAVHAAHAHALTRHARRTWRTLGHAAAAETRIHLRIRTELRAVDPGANGIACWTLTLTRNTGIADGTIRLTISAMSRIRRQIGAHVAASRLSRRTNALPRNAHRIVRTAIAAHATVVLVRRDIDATSVALHAEDCAAHAYTLSGHTHTSGPAIGSALTTIVRIG